MRTYQTIVVIDSLLKKEEIDSVIEKIIRIINNNGGKAVTIDRWEKRRLAYEIKKRQYGYYVEIVFEAPYNLVKILEHDYRLDENILRYLTVQLDKKALAQVDKQKVTKTAVREEIPEVEYLDIDEEIELASLEETSSDQKVAESE